MLVEKLLRSTAVSKIYLLIRPKKGVATAQRLKLLLETKIFDRVREEQAEVLSKVEAVAGDITEQRLGLSDEEERWVDGSVLAKQKRNVFRLLADSVNIIFHCAATVRFDEELTKVCKLSMRCQDYFPFVFHIFFSCLEQL